MNRKSRSAIFCQQRIGLFCGRGASGRHGVSCTRFSEGDIGPECGKITILRGGYGEMSV